MLSSRSSVFANGFIVCLVCNTFLWCWSVDKVLGQVVVRDHTTDFGGPSLPDGWAYGYYSVSNGAFTSFSGSHWSAVNSDWRMSGPNGFYRVSASEIQTPDHNSYKTCARAVFIAGFNARIEVTLTTVQDLTLVVNGVVVDTLTSVDSSSDVTTVLPAKSVVELRCLGYGQTSTITRFRVTDLDQIGSGGGEGEGGTGECCCPECLALLSSIAGNTDDIETILNSMDGKLTDLHTLAGTRNGLLLDSKLLLDSIDSEIESQGVTLSSIDSNVAALLQPLSDTVTELGTINTTLESFALQNTSDLAAVVAAVDAISLADDSAILTEIRDNTLPLLGFKTLLDSIDSKSVEIASSLSEFAARDLNRDTILIAILQAIQAQTGSGGGSGDMSSVVDKLDEILTALGSVDYLGDISNDLIEFQASLESKLDDLIAWDLKTELQEIRNELGQGGTDTVVSLLKEIRTNTAGQLQLENLSELNGLTARDNTRKTQLDTIIAKLETIAINSGSGGGIGGGQTDSLLGEIRDNTAAIKSLQQSYLGSIALATQNTAGFAGGTDSKMSSLVNYGSTNNAQNLTRNNYLSGMFQQNVEAYNQRESSYAQQETIGQAAAQAAYTREGQLAEISSKLSGGTGPESAPTYTPPDDSSYEGEFSDSEASVWDGAYGWIAELGFQNSGSGFAQTITILDMNIGESRVLAKWPIEANEGLEWTESIRLAVRTALTWFCTITLYLKAFKVF